MYLIDYTAYYTAFAAGLLGSGHCFAMCGGIATGLGSAGSREVNTKPQLLNAVLFNSGRLLSYALLGLISGWLMMWAGKTLQLSYWSMILRLLTALVILLIGLQFLCNWNTLALIERVGTRIWALILPMATRASALPGGSGRMLLGLCWGLLPCGLVYSILFTAAAAGNHAAGALVMLSFGMGTLPSMLGMSLAAPALSNLLGDRWTRKLIGLSLILLALLGIFLLIIHKQSAHH